RRDAVRINLDAVASVYENFFSVFNEKLRVKFILSSNFKTSLFTVIVGAIGSISFFNSYLDLTEGIRNGVPKMKDLFSLPLCPKSQSRWGIHAQQPRLIRPQLFLKALIPQRQALGTTFEARVQDYMAAHTERMERFENAIFKQREEINDRMTKMFKLLKELMTSRAPKKSIQTPAHETRMHHQSNALSLFTNVSALIPQRQALGTTFEARVQDYMAAHTERMERFENAIFKQREEINDRMTKMFKLLKELMTSRAPKKVLIREGATFPITKNVKSISLTRWEEERSEKTDITTCDNLEKPTKMPVKGAVKEDEVENEPNRKVEKENQPRHLALNPLNIT
nr:hypothetical protein [Tanacetum cinerariifolium]